MKFSDLRWSEYRDRLLDALAEVTDPAEDSPPAASESPPAALPTTQHRAERDVAVDRRVLACARQATTLGAVPVANLVGVVALQARMLHDLAGLHGTRWSRATAADLISRLGPRIAGGLVGQTLGRSALKLVPVLGSTVGAAWSARSAGVSTYALGRAADWYLEALGRGEKIDDDTLRRVHRAAAQSALQVLSGNNPEAPR
ncbi:MAG TPA: DUF697 domain-containing protein [Azoarcus sp.]|nr:DUF697 domain-containing protein [Azoarcus sp.]